VQLAVPKKPNPTARQFKVGDKIRVPMHSGKIVDAIIKAVIDETNGLDYQIDVGNEQTALISER
jgi:RNA polymerase-interacting CarD/CdnL/TRCF family regulator